MKMREHVQILVRVSPIYCKSNRKIKKTGKKLFWKNCAWPANEFLFHKCKNNWKIQIRAFEKLTSPVNEFLFHKFRNYKKIQKDVKEKKLYLKKCLHTVEAISK